MDNIINNANPIGPVSSAPVFPKKIQVGAEGKVDFGKMFQGFMEDVNHLQHKSDESIQRMVAGEIKDPHQVMLAMGEAKMALNLLVEVRNKVMEAYREIINMRG